MLFGNQKKHFEISIKSMRGNEKYKSPAKPEGKGKVLDTEIFLFKKNPKGDVRLWVQRILNFQ